MAQFDDIQTVGPLIESLTLPDIAVVTIAKDRLNCLLPRLKASDASLLTAEQRQILCKQLTQRMASSSPDFLVAILTALEQIGDEDALPAVCRLAESVVATPAGKPVQEAAQNCLHTLQTRAAEQESRQTLLRASSSITTAPETLLRPAAGGVESDPQQLLRAARRKRSES